METIVSAAEHDYRKVCEIIYALKGTYPFINVRSLGKSAIGRDIYAMEIGKSSEKVLFAGAFHGMERLTCLVLLRFAEQLAKAYQSHTEIAGVDARNALFGRGIIIVPLVNPDGYEIALNGAIGAGYLASKVKKLCGGDFSIWNANARGVDINHNFDAGWCTLHKMEQEAGIYGPAPRRYGGPSPESEPETYAMTKLCRSEKIRHVLAFHSQGEEIYWRYGENTPERSRKMVDIMAASSGYAVEDPEGMASHGGFKDWFIEQFCRPGFTIEIGRGENPLDPRELDPIYNKIQEMMVLAMVM